MNTHGAADAEDSLLEPDSASQEMLAPITRLWSATAPHASLVLAGAVSILVPFKLLRVAHGDLTVALAIGQHVEKATLLSGILVLLTPLFILLLFVTLTRILTIRFASIRLASRRGDAEAVRRSVRTNVPPILALTAALAVITWLLGVIVPAEYFFVGCMLIVIADVPEFVLRTRLRAPRDRPLPPWLRQYPFGLFFAVSGLFFVTVLFMTNTLLTAGVDDRMWLPPHDLTLKGGHHLTAYVLDASDSQVVVLTQDDRGIALLPRASITADELCAINHRDGRSVRDLITRVKAHALPECS